MKKFQNISRNFLYLAKRSNLERFQIMSQREFLTEREKVCLIYAIRTNNLNTTEDWKKAFILSRQTLTENHASQSTHKASVSRWKCSDKVKSFVEEETRKWNDLITHIKTEAVADYIRKIQNEDGTDGNKNVTVPSKEQIRNKIVSGVDFQDREQFLEFLNKQANSITDEKERLNYLKLISDLLRLKETDTKSNEEIQRFYTPLQCDSCPMYLKAKQ